MSNTPTTNEIQEEKPPLIDVVIKSLYANLILYRRERFDMPTNALIATPKINDTEVDCIVVANDRSGIVVVEYPFAEPVRECVWGEVLGFMDGVNIDAGLGHLFIEPTSRLPIFKDGLNAAYLSDTEKDIAAFIKETGAIAFTYFPYLKSIMEDKATAEMELKLLETMSSWPHLQGRMN